MSGSEPIFRVWGWEERPPCGRRVYVYHMALEFLLARGIPIPPRFAKSLSDDLKEWERLLAASDREFVAAHEVTSAGIPAVTEAAYGLFLRKGDLPPEAQLDDTDWAFIEGMVTSPVVWDELDAQREWLLTHRLAVGFVIEANGAVPEGVVRELVEAVARDNRNSRPPG